MIGTDPAIVQHDAFNTAEELSICLVAQVRQALNLTQEQIAQLLGMHAQNVSKAENDRYTLSRDCQSKLLILREISHVPGIVVMLPFLIAKCGGSDAYVVARQIHWAVTI
jgi:DNA-binding transcriptional regulator YiaG